MPHNKILPCPIRLKDGDSVVADARFEERTSAPEACYMTNDYIANSNVSSNGKQYTWLNSKVESTVASCTVCAGRAGPTLSAKQAVTLKCDRLFHRVTNCRYSAGAQLTPNATLRLATPHKRHFVFSQKLRVAVGVTSQVRQTILSATTLASVPAEHDTVPDIARNADSQEADG